MKTKTADEVEMTLTKDLRQTLKAIVQKELEQLPGYLEGLEPKERLNIICKIMPFVLPKVEAVKPSAGEPFIMEWD
jgi:hypothetical protein